MAKVKSFPYSDILGWSISRFDKFMSCKRQYFYDYYAKFDKEIPIEKLLFLKKLTSRALETGNIVHDIIRDMLKRYQKSAKPINVEKFYKYAHEMTLKYCRKTFHESYYGSMLVSPEEIYEKVKMILDNLLASERFKWIRQEAIATNDQWIIEPDGYGETRINDMKAYCKVDFAFPLGDKIYILDWKTGKPDIKKHSRQLIGYCIWANFHFEKPVENIVPIDVYLFPEFYENSIEINDQIVSEFSQRVAQETQEMFAYLSDTQNNIPKDKSEFMPVKNRLCAYCNYREVCGA